MACVAANEGRERDPVNEAGITFFLDESGGLDGARQEHLVVAGVAMAPRDARRVVKRFRASTQWRASEIKGSDMDASQQGRFLERLAAGHVHSVGALACATQRLPSGIGRMHGEATVYAALVATVISDALVRDIPISSIVADGGRYSRKIVAELCTRIPTLVAAMSGATCVPLVFADSRRFEGLQCADVLANASLRRIRAAAGTGFADDPIRGIRGGVSGVPSVPATVLINGTYHPLLLPPDLHQVPPPPDSVGYMELRP